MNWSPLRQRTYPFHAQARLISGDSMQKLDDLVRRCRVLGALDIIDQVVLGEAGFRSADILGLRCAWDKLSQRRRRWKSKARTV